MKRPTEAQQGVLNAIRSLTAEKGYPPSVREIGEAVGLSSPSTVHAHLNCLLRDGHIRRDPRSPRALIVSEPVENWSMSWLNLACWLTGLLTYIAGGTARCEHEGCTRAATLYDPALDLRTCDAHTGGTP